MNPIDLRNETWETLQARVTGLRLAVLDAWRTHGQGTTRMLALRSGIDILIVRPRTTELVDLGLVRLVGRKDHEGIYEYIPAAAAHEMFLERRDGRAVQTELPLC
jgi:hypothetical protein